MYNDIVRKENEILGVMADAGVSSVVAASWFSLEKEESGRYNRYRFSVWGEGWYWVDG